MKKIMVSIIFVASAIFAALPPQVQKVKDLDQMVDYVKSHPKVAATLRGIDVQKKVIRFGAGCKVIFERKASIQATGVVRSAEPLVVKRSTCLDDQD